MPTNKPRIQVTLSEKYHDIVKGHAIEERKSMSQIVNKIIENYYDRKNELSSEEQLIVNAYRYGTNEDKKTLWKAFLEVDEQRFKRQNEQKNKIIKIGRDNNGNITM